MALSKVQGGLVQHINLLTAVLTVIAAVLGVVSVVATGAAGDAQDQVDTVQRQLASERATSRALRDTNDALQETNAEQSALIEDLKEKQASLGEPAAPDTPAAMSTPPVRNTGRVVIGSDALDLNAAPGDAKWGIGETPHGSPDVIDFSNGILTIWSSLFQPPGQVDAGYVSCSNATGYPEPQITVAAKDLEGQTYCVRLRSGRYATLEVAESSRTTATLELTTWERE